MCLIACSLKIRTFILYEVLPGLGDLTAKICFRIAGGPVKQNQYIWDPAPPAGWQLLHLPRTLSSPFLC